MRHQVGRLNELLRAESCIASVHVRLKCLERDLDRDPGNFIYEFVLALEAILAHHRKRSMVPL